MWYGPWKFSKSKKVVLKEARVLDLVKEGEEVVTRVQATPEPGTTVWWLTEVTPIEVPIEILIATDLIYWFPVEGTKMGQNWYLTRTRPGKLNKLYIDEGKIQSKIYEGELAVALLMMGQGDKKIIAQAANSFVDGGE